MRRFTLLIELPPAINSREWLEAARKMLAEKEQDYEYFEMTRPA
jgi:hypothetical protein